MLNIGTFYIKSMAYNREVGRSNECEKMLSAERRIHGEKEWDMYTDRCKIKYPLTNLQT